ncbi:hypothetical protein QFC21_004003 [Naganishia friedmannii]|uniref:Uncharacterized protein n=1 Tax=Naganishia friedmannii TaxID=89922 RepID=A0ACC2VIZ0_9TREE|nr:hypothetical protein QFC21_004003 [Naganishia friedmannii]
MSSPSPPRKKRRTSAPPATADDDSDHRPDIARAANLIASAQNILVIAGAGISTSCGIPDFRSKDGLYALLSSLDDPTQATSVAVDEIVDVSKDVVVMGKEKPRRSSRIAAAGSDVAASCLAEEGYHIVDPQEIMDVTVFRAHPEVFYNYAHRLFPGKEVRYNWQKNTSETPSSSTVADEQNIDGLESQAGISRRLFHAHALRAAIMKREVPLCERCLAKRIDAATTEDGAGKRKRGQVVGVYKPDITFFHEPVSRKFHSQVEKDLPLVDLCVVIGTSLLIPPVRDIPGRLPGNAPRILINRDTVKGVDWTGDCDDIIRELDRYLFARDNQST